MMNKYLITTIYVLTGCVAAVPFNTYNINSSLKISSCKQLIASQEKVIKIVEESTFFCENDKDSEFSFPEIKGNSKALTSLYFLTISAWLTPDTSTNQIRAPGIA